MEPLRTPTPLRPFPARSSLAGALLFGLLGLLFYRAAEMRQDEATSPRIAAVRAPLLDEEQATIALFQGASASVVHVTNIDLRRRAFAMDVQAVPRSTAAGWCGTRRATWSPTTTSCTGRGRRS